MTAKPGGALGRSDVCEAAPPNPRQHDVCSCDAPRPWREPSETRGFPEEETIQSQEQG